MGTANVAVKDEQSRATLFEVPRLEPYVESAAEGVTVSRSMRQRRVASALAITDVVALLAAAAIATSVSGVATPSHQVFSAIFVVITLGLMAQAQLYRISSLGWGSAEFTRVWRSVAAGVVTTVVGMFALGVPGPSRVWALSVAVFGIAAVTLGRSLMRTASAHLMKRGSWLQRPTLIVGSNGEAAELASLLKAHAASGLVPVGCLRSSLKDTLSFDYCAPCLPTLGIARDLRSVVTEHEIDTVIIVASAFDYEVVQRMIKDLRDMSVSIHISSALNEVLSDRVVMRQVSGVPLISLRGVSLSESKIRGKRIFDSLVAGLIIALGMPLWATIAALVKLTSKGPVFYRQERIGRGGVPFRMYKFRSMVVDADARLADLQRANQADGPMFKMKNDPRVTPMGRWMRKFSLDEFPQLINVLRGEMSLVGPRPPLPKEIAHYAEQDWRRLEVLPGMTGLWQVSGRSKLTFRDMVRLDVFYIDNWSLGLDLSLLARTVPAVVLARGAY